MLRNACLLFLLSPLALAEPYSLELDLQYNEVSHEYSELFRINSPVIKSPGYTAGFQYYLSDIDNGEYPVAEVGFISRVSNIRFKYKESESSRKIKYSQLISIFGDYKKQIDVFGEYIHADSGWFINGEYSNFNSNGGGHNEYFDSNILNNSSSKYKKIINSFSVSIGKYYNSNLSLSFLYGRGKEKYNGDSLDDYLCTDDFYFNCGIINYKQTKRFETYAFNIKYLDQIYSYYYSIELTYQKEKRIHHYDYNYRVFSPEFRQNNPVFSFDTLSDFSLIYIGSPDLRKDKEKREKYGVTFTFFPKNNISISLNYEESNHYFKVDRKQYGIQSEYFLRNNISLNLSYLKFKSENYFDTYYQDNVSIGMKKRF